MEIILFLGTGLAAFLVYALFKIMLAKELSSRLVDAYILLPPKNRPALLWEAGDILGRTPDPLDLPTELARIFLTGSLVGMVFRYFRMTRLIAEAAHK